MPKIKRINTSIMTKSNRVSLADTINIRQIEILKEIVPIQSAESIETESIMEIKSKEDLISTHSEDDFSSIDLKPMEHNYKKVSIMINSEEGTSGNSSVITMGNSVSSLFS